MEDNSNILSTLRMELDAEGLDYRKSSVLQGILFEKMDPAYADEMHRQQLHPYSQYLTREEGKTLWHVNTFSREAHDEIIKPLLEVGFTDFQLKHGGIDAKILGKTYTVRSYKELLDEFYSKEKVRSIGIRLVSLASFRQRGRYNTVPDLRLIYQSLMMKYGAVSGNSDMMDEDTLTELCEQSYVSSYHLRTGVFPVEGNKIPGFMGNMTVRLCGTDTLSRYVRLLFRFGEYSGIGVKTGMGMGAMKVSIKTETTSSTVPPGTSGRPEDIDQNGGQV